MFLLGGFSRLSINAEAAGDASKQSAYGAAAASMVFIFTFIFGATWLTVPWLYPAEIFPLAVRSKGNAWGVVGWSIGNGVSNFTSLEEQIAKIRPVAGIALPSHVRQHQREDFLHLWRQ